MAKRIAAECLGTFWLVLGGCGSAVISATFPQVGIGLVGVSLAFGLTVVTMAYAVGHISGGHFNPAVTVGLFTARRIPAAHVLPYVLAQLVGAIVAAAILRERQAWLQPRCQRLGRQRLWRSFPWRLFACLRICRRGSADLLLSVHHSRRN
jgi:glycerol uptake facilitator-like aquaporin